jgi:Na+/proline symporter
MYMGFDRAQTLFAGLIGGAFLSMASHGADQLIVQRLLAASSLKDARKALIGSGIAVFFQFALFLIIGVGLFALYHGRHFDVPDSIFPTFVVDSMPAGLRGLLVAAVLAATMSAHSGALNSLAAATTHDIFLPLTGRSADDPRTLRVGKLFTMFWGVLLLLMALLYPEQGTPVVIVALSIASFTYGALLGGFFLGMLWRRANQRDAITGMAVGIVAMSFVVFAKQMIPLFPSFTATLTTLSHIAWPWYVLIGTTFTVGVGILSSFTHPAPTGASRWK